MIHRHVYLNKARLTLAQFFCYIPCHSSSVWSISFLTYLSPVVFLGVSNFERRISIFVFPLYFFALSLRRLSYLSLAVLLVTLTLNVTVKMSRSQCSKTVALWPAFGHRWRGGPTAFSGRLCLPACKLADPRILWGNDKGKNKLHLPFRSIVLAQPLARRLGPCAYSFGLLRLHSIFRNDCWGIKNRAHSHSDESSVNYPTLSYSDFRINWCFSRFTWPFLSSTGSHTPLTLFGVLTFVICGFLYILCFRWLQASVMHYPLWELHRPVSLLSPLMSLAQTTLRRYGVGFMENCSQKCWLITQQRAL